MLKGVVSWSIGQNGVLRLIDDKRAAVFEFTEVEGGLYQGLSRDGYAIFLRQGKEAEIFVFQTYIATPMVKANPL